MRTSDALRVRPPYNAPHRTTPRFNIELGSSLERDVGDCAINGSERTMFSMRTAVFVIVGALVVLLLGVSAPIVRAAGPTLTIVSPADHAVIGNGSSVPVIFVVSGFNLTPPGTGGPGPSPTEGHVDVYVDGVLTLAVSEETIDLSLASGTYTILLRLFSAKGTALSPDAASSISVTVTPRPSVRTPGILIRHLEDTYLTPISAFGCHVYIVTR